MVLLLIKHATWYHICILSTLVVLRKCLRIFSGFLIMQFKRLFLLACHVYLIMMFLREQLTTFTIIHNDAIKWKHFPRYWPFVRVIHRSAVNSPHKGQWRGVLVFSLICAWIKGWVNNLEAGDLRRHRAHYDVTAIIEAFAHWYVDTSREKDVSSVNVWSIISNMHHTCLYALTKLRFAHRHKLYIYTYIYIYIQHILHARRHTIS